MRWFASLSGDAGKMRSRHIHPFDGDVVEDTNIATQGTFISELGKLKVEVIKARILDINPLAHVVCIPKYLDNAITDEDFFKMAMLKNGDFRDTLLCGCTDNFYAQDRCAQLSVKYGIPYLAAQILKKAKVTKCSSTIPD